MMVEKSDNLKEGTYTLHPWYCTDVKCDCRLVKIAIMRDFTHHVATVQFGWESARFYSEWMGVPKDDPMVQDMAAGATLDMTSPAVHPDIMQVFNGAMNDEWLRRIKRNYEAVKAYQKKVYGQQAWRRPRKARVKRIGR